MFATIHDFKFSTLELSVYDNKLRIIFDSLEGAALSGGKGSGLNRAGERWSKPEEMRRDLDWVFWIFAIIFV